MKAHDVRRTGQSESNGPREIDPGRSWTVEIPAAHTLNIGASVTGEGVFFGSWGLLRRPVENVDYRYWDKSDGTVYALRLDGESMWEADLDLVPRCYEYPDRGPNLLWCGLTPYEVSYYNGTVEGQAAIDTIRGVLYAGRGDGRLYALDLATGAVRWRFVTYDPERVDDPDGGGEIVSAPLVGPAGTVYFGTWGEGNYETNAFYAVNPDSTLQWRYPASTSLEHSLFASPALSPDSSTVYAGTFLDDDNRPGRLFAFRTGSFPDVQRLKWELELKHNGASFRMTTMAVGTDGTIYVGGYKQEGFGLIPLLLAVEDRGTEAAVKWGYVELRGAAQHVLGIALREIGGETVRLYVTTANLGTPIFNGLEEGRLYAIDSANGAVLSTYDPTSDVPEAVGGINSPAIGADGAVYFGVRGRYGNDARQGHYFGVTYDEAARTFSELWHVKVDGYVEWSHPAIGPDGGLYAGSSSLDDASRGPTYTEGTTPEGTTAWFHALKGPPGNVAAENEVPGGNRLHPAYPNPFRTSTTLEVELGSSETVQVEVFDILGRRIESLGDGTYGPGRHTFRWYAGAATPSGTYLVRIQVGEANVSNTVVVLSRQ